MSLPPKHVTNERNKNRLKRSESRFPRDYTENRAPHFSSSHAESVNQQVSAADIRTSSPAKTSNQIPIPTILPTPTFLPANSLNLLLLATPPPPARHE
ncbi:hypothetical protein N7504_002005 [Penicillium tannophilum]|nr:hypothetical protein N7504_002005 [Penicillium tannophilum]